jgi:tetratricopeptide (TPR) repeat protein
VTTPLRRPVSDESAAPAPDAVSQLGIADHDAMVNQAGRDIHVHAAVPQPAAGKAASAKPLVVPHRRVVADRLRGRDELLAVLMAAVTEIRAGRKADTQVLVLHGMGGSGKTTVAVEVAHRAQSAGVRCWWVAVTDSADLEASLHAVAFDLGADEGELSRGHPADVLWRRLDLLAEPWLLVLDNADDPDLLAAGTGRLADGRGWLRSPKTGYGLVLVTSRESAQSVWGASTQSVWGNWGRLVPVPALDEVDGGQVLRDLAPDAGDEREARALGAWLGGLPLALDLAGHYLADARASLWPRAGAPDTFAAYQAALEEHLDTLGADQAAPAEEQARRKLTTTWELSLDLLADRGAPLARPLLRLLACFGPAPIPYVGLLDAALLAASPPLSDATEDALVRAMEGLNRLGLVSVTSTGSADARLRRAAILPPLVRATNRAHPDLAARSQQYQDLLVALLDRVTAGAEPEDPQFWPQWSAIAAHCRAPLQVPGLPAGAYAPGRVVLVTQPAHLAARYLQAAGFYAQAAAEQREVVRHRRQALGDADPDTLTARQYLALALRDEGRLDAARTEYADVLELRAGLLGHDHPDTLTSRHGHASVLRRQGFLDRAEAEYREVLGLRERVLGAEHPDTLATRQNLAFVLMARDQERAAEDEYRSILDIQRRTLGDEHLQTLATRHYLAIVLAAQGRLDEAEREYRTLLALLQAKLGADHPETLVTRHALAYLLKMRRRYAEAEAEYRAIIEIQQVKFGADHPATLATRHNLAVALQDQGRLDEAEEEFAAVLKGRRLVIGEHNPDTLDTRHAAAYVLRLRGQYADAEAEYRAIIEIQRASLGEDHPATLGTRHNLGVVLEDQGRLDEAAEEYAGVLRIREQVLGTDHRDTVDTRGKLAAVRAEREGLAPN